MTCFFSTSRSSSITFSEIQVFKSASTSPVEATEGWLVACHSHLALLFVCASQTEHYSQATIDRYASIWNHKSHVRSSSLNQSGAIWVILHQTSATVLPFPAQPSWPYIHSPAKVKHPLQVGALEEQTMTINPSHLQTIDKEDQVLKVVSCGLRLKLQILEDFGSRPPTDTCKLSQLRITKPLPSAFRRLASMMIRWKGQPNTKVTKRYGWDLLQKMAIRANQWASVQLTGVS